MDLTWTKCTVDSGWDTNGDTMPVVKLFHNFK